MSWPKPHPPQRDYDELVAAAFEVLPHFMGLPVSGAQVFRFARALCRIDPDRARQLDAHSLCDLLASVPGVADKGDGGNPS